MIDRITQTQYGNLRKQHRILSNHVLGEDYYNMGMSVCEVDECTVADLITEYDYLKETNRFKNGVIIILVLFIILSFILGGAF